MSGNTQALESMAKMIQTMLPYDYGYKPESNSGQAIFEIFEIIRINNPKIEEFVGFVGHILKKLDQSGKEDKADRMLMQIYAVLHKHYPPISEPEVKQIFDSELGHGAEIIPLDPKADMGEPGEDKPVWDDSETPMIFHPFDRGQYSNDVKISDSTKP